MLDDAITRHKPVKRQLFPEKLWDLVNKPSSGIQWSPDGKRIEVERTQLEKFIGTKFRSRNFDSFIRQLHFYGFRKCGNSYHHDMFQRGKPDSLYSMKRKYSNLTSGSICRSPSSVSSIYSPVKLRSPPAPTLMPTSTKPSTKPSTLAAPGSHSTSSKQQAQKQHQKQASKHRSQHSSTLIDKTAIEVGLGDKMADSERAVIYSLRGDYDSRFLLNKPNEYITINEDITHIRKEGNCLVIAMPESLKLQIGHPRPQFLVIEGSLYGSTTVLTAHYVYHCVRQVGPGYKSANNDTNPKLL